MATKKVTYTQLLKEALSDNVAEFDTTKTIDTTGPMTKQILSYKGDGELKTNSDAASILERYYFKDSDSGVEALEEGHLGNELDAEPAKNINKTKKDMEKDIVEAEETEDPEKGDEGGEEKVEEGIQQEGDELTEAEEAVLERLIAEMEGDDEGDGKEEELDVDDEMGDSEEKVEEGKKVKKETDTSMDDDEGGEDEDLEEAALGPLGHPHDAESYENLEEAFKIFSEEIEDETIDVDDDEVQV